ncbi:hypothetical protein NL676_013551 [Syzygium grande]|nr:hypothetical protein NL676_013551 [Syzygium grande]
MSVVRQGSNLDRRCRDGDIVDIDMEGDPNSRSRCTRLWRMRKSTRSLLGQPPARPAGLVAVGGRPSSLASFLSGRTTTVRLSLSLYFVLFGPATTEPPPTALPGLYNPDHLPGPSVRRPLATRPTLLPPVHPLSCRRRYSGCCCWSCCPAILPADSHPF